MLSSMPNPTHLSILRKGVEAWNLWREENPDVTPDLNGADLRGLDLDVAIYTHPSVDLEDFPPDENGVRWSADPFGIDLHDARLRKTDLSDVKLTIADLSTANLTGATLNGTTFEGASLRGACLREADLTRASFRSCDLADVDFADAHISEIIIADSDLSTARGLESVHHHAPSLIAIDTLVKSHGLISANFLAAVGLPDLLITYLPTLIGGMQPIQFLSCFISYSYKDRVFAERLYEWLQTNGVRCWLDQKQLLPGDDLYDAVERGIRRSDKVLLCCSCHSLTSWWVDHEIGAALEKEQHLTKMGKRQARVLIPLNLDDYMFDPSWQSGYRAQFRRRSAANFVGWDSSDSVFDEAARQVILALDPAHPAPHS
jgi:hypothetical protein